MEKDLVCESIGHEGDGSISNIVEMEAGVQSRRRSKVGARELGARTNLVSSNSFMRMEKRGVEDCFDDHGNHDGEHKKQRKLVQDHKYDGVEMIEGNQSKLTMAEDADSSTDHHEFIILELPQTRRPSSSSCTSRPD